MKLKIGDRILIEGRKEVFIVVRILPSGFFEFNLKLKCVNSGDLYDFMGCIESITVISFINNPEWKQIWDQNL
jgi:hypothetical protein